MNQFSFNKVTLRDYYYILFAFNYFWKEIEKKDNVSRKQDFGNLRGMVVSKREYRFKRLKLLHYQYPINKGGSWKVHFKRITMAIK